MLTIAELRKKLLSGEITAVELVKKTLQDIREKDENINAFIAVYDDAIEEAKMADERIAKEGDKVPPLCGIPVAIKNNILIKGKKATAASKMLENYTATYDATIIAKLKAAGAILIGATNMDEFAMGSSTESSYFGVTKNPLDPERVPGGSSGGSAAAVAMGVVPVAIGTDTGGSVRQPASYCGLVAFKPTYGAVSRNGLIAMGSSLDQAGPLTNTVADAEAVHEIMAGLDPLDMTTIAPDTYDEVVIKDSYTIGVPRHFLADGVDKDVLEVFEEQLKTLESEGHKVVDIELPLFEQGLAAYYIVMPAEVSSNLARYDGIRYGLSVDGDTLLDVYEKTRAEGFGKEVKRRILLGTYVLSSGYYDAYYRKAELVRSKMRRELNDVFTSVDAIVLPTTPTPAFKFGEKSSPLAMYREDIFTVPVNLAGVPAISFPMGKVEREGVSLPVGVQYIAPHGGDARLFNIGKRLYDERI
ncbi:MAG: Asp-tRNA(Asn)/Glu-tRNA(Gln) amidotransferase subunit GatA [Candidatus Nomurabacteria bacterium]|nr:MAG: Asp-tRNA(Asn)/Glu-tRNA(Gln) amidotransferase subunit GatA [Candidatus Nomurabacteria bacterium]